MTRSSLRDLAGYDSLAVTEKVEASDHNVMVGRVSYCPLNMASKRSWPGEGLHFQDHSGTEQQEGLAACQQGRRESMHLSLELTLGSPQTADDCGMGLLGQRKEVSLESKARGEKISDAIKEDKEEAFKKTRDVPCRDEKEVNRANPGMLHLPGSIGEGHTSSEKPLGKRRAPRSGNQQKPSQQNVEKARDSGNTFGNISDLGTTRVRQQSLEGEEQPPGTPYAPGEKKRGNEAF